MLKVPLDKVPESDFKALIYDSFLLAVGTKAEAQVSWITNELRWRTQAPTTQRVFQDLEIFEGT